MIYLFQIFFLTLTLWAKQTVIISYFDPFGRSTKNNSQIVAFKLKEAFNADSAIVVKLCPLKTIFDHSYAQLENCLKDQISPPSLILGLGEANCRLKIETVARNVDKTMGPDNAGNERRGTPIIHEGETVLGFTYPLKQMFCALDSKERKDIILSNDAGSFVCNNVAYQFRYFYPEQIFGFIHVPTFGCRQLEEMNVKMVDQLKRMIIEAIKVTEHTFLPTTKKELLILRRDSQNECHQEFYNRSRGIDEKGLWPVLN